MQLNNQSPLLLASTKEAKITIKNDYLQTVQKRFAAATIAIPLIGTLIALKFAWDFGISLIELELFLVFWFLTMVGGVTVGNHRLLSHCSFKTHPSVRVTLAILGSMAAQGPVINWVSNHRRHHQYSDQIGDTHSPNLYQGEPWGKLRGMWHSHIGWMLTGELTNSTVFAKDLLQDSVMTKINQQYLTFVVLGLLIPSILGGLLSGTWIGIWQGFLWGGLVRIFVVHHLTWSLNSIVHLYGSRSFNTNEKSTNNVWLAIPTGGEAWHNNHHAFPNSAKFGLQWWQVDLGDYLIRTLEVLGLAWDVKVPTPGMIEAKKTAC
ncbi:MULTISPECIES: acyl-CoA desaturase [unclassified Nostoc]|uniref:acyl-CoA desaturase n=1 Tax=unclassified Nostoc TaxID=2593658 RepID=UPI000B950BA2|nr:acyl-CoA desaturase [Nostoc sp. 'Peltigera membranacea cyanobiont' 232]OYE06842.1 acyl-CoA desaturase [Nostoc sp. 'Peltigera membranacea cyanobiont' 232]